jgi:hypothetical protein
MPKFDQQSIDSVIERSNKIEEDAKPIWGSMSPAQMRAHMVTAIRYSLSKEEHSPDESTFVVKNILGPLIINGIIKLPKNIDKPKLYDASAPTATIEELKTEMDEFLAKLNSGSFDPPVHPALGDLGATGWAKLHDVHADHHLRQFGV